MLQELLKHMRLRDATHFSEKDSDQKNMRSCPTSQKMPDS